jgi:ribose 5-phosphate isomerase B
LKKIFIASDHAGFNLKENIKKKFSSNFEFLDLGPKNSKKSVNYPDYAHKLSKQIKKKNVGILVCGSGMGMAMSANKHKNIRAALCYSVKNAKLSRLHNDANVIT